jgi:hypothetical protein
MVVAGLSAAAVVSWYQWQALGHNQLQAKLVEYQEAVKLAERDTLGKGPKPTDKPLQAVLKALALSDEVKRMRGSPPDTADADAVRLYEYAAINSAEIGDPAGANRYLAMRTELLARSPELIKKVGALVAIDPNALTVLDLQMELLAATTNLSDEEYKDDVEMWRVMHNYENVFITLNEVFPRNENYDWLSYLQYMQAKNYEHRQKFADAQSYWEAQVQTARERLKWARQSPTLIGSERQRSVLKAAQAVAQAEGSLAEYQERRQNFAAAAAAARQGLTTFDENPELADDASLRWDMRAEIADALLKSGQPDLARDERVAAADEFVNAGSRKLGEAKLELARRWRKAGDFHAQQKDPDRAADAYVQVLDLLRPLSAGDKDTKSLLFETLGAYGELKSQMKAFPDALNALEELVKRTRADAVAGDPSSQLALADSLEKYGQAKSDAGDMAGALASYQEAVAIRRTVLSSLGANQEDLNAWRVLVDQSEAQLKSGDLAKALDLEHRAVEMSMAAATKNDRRTKTMLLIAFELDRVASMQDKSQNYGDTASAYAECLEILRERRADLNANIDGRQYFLELLAKLSSAHSKAYHGETATAPEVLQKGFELASDQRKVAGIIASNQKERDRTVIDMDLVDKEAGLFAYRQKDYVRALAYFQERVKYLREEPSEGDAARATLSSALQDVADALEELERWPQALDSNREALAIAEGLAQSDPKNAQRRAELAHALSLVAWDLSKVERPDESLPLYERALTIRQELAAAGDARAGGDVRNTAGDMGALAYELVLARKFDEALRASDLAIAVAPPLLWVQVNRAHALMFLGRTAEAKAIYLAHRGEKDGSKDETIWDEDVKADFAEFRKAGMVNPLIDEIEAALAAPANQDASAAK